MNVVLFRYHFKPRWPMIVLTILAVALFMRLGFWQIARACEKKQMLATVSAFSKQAPKVWQPASPMPKQYQPLRVQGRFLPTVFLLDNQHYQHQFGYDVISPLLLPNGHVVLVDRGWIVADLMHHKMPVIDIPKGSSVVVGSAYYSSSKNWILGQAIEKKNKDLAIIELVDTHLLSQFLHKSVYPFIIRLSSHAENGFVRDWPVVAMSIERHYGYALQWFAIALVIFILFIALNCKKKT